MVTSPTTQIIKLPLGLGLVGNMQVDMRTSVYNEWLCLKLMGALGFDVAHADIVTFADHAPVLVVERFDRKLHPSGEWILRLPQEDFCKAYGVNPAIKYEAEGTRASSNWRRCCMARRTRALICARYWPARSPSG